MTRLKPFKTSFGMNWETYKLKFPKIMTLYWLGSQGANIVLKQALKSAL